MKFLNRLCVITERTGKALNIINKNFVFICILDSVRNISCNVDNYTFSNLLNPINDKHQLIILSNNMFIGD